MYYGSHSSSLELKLTGTGVVPSVKLIPKGDTCDMGHVLATDTTTKTLQVRCLLVYHTRATNVARNVALSSIQLKNRSPLSVRYHAQLESLLVSSVSNRKEHPFSKY